jgi:hypothetical protein
VELLSSVPAAKDSHVTWWMMDLLARGKILDFHAGLIAALVAIDRVAPGYASEQVKRIASIPLPIDGQAWERRLTLTPVAALAQNTTYTSERTIASFEGFFTVIGEQLAAQIEFVCSDMWQPYLDVIRQRCSQALHILDRFHIVAKMNKALDEVRAAESRKMAQDGHPPLLKKSRWCVLKRKQNLTSQQKFRL